MRQTGVTGGSSPGQTVLALGVAAVVLVALLGGAAGAHGTVYPVTKTQDTNDGTCDDDCSLREAVNAARDSSGADSITLPEGRFTLTIAGADEDLGATGDLDIRGGELSITGQGPAVTIIDASGLGDRVFDVQAQSGATVHLEALTVSGGDCSAVGGGIYTGYCHLVLDNTVLRENQSARSGGGVYCASGDLTVQGGSFISDNACSTLWYGGGIMCPTLTVTDSTVAGNLGGSGGGIASLFGNVTIAGSTIAHNRTEGYDGGAIYTEASVIAVSNSSLVGNYSGRIGGAVYAAVAGAIVTLDGVTVSGNSSSAGDSIVVYNSANVVLTNTLVSGTCVTISGGVLSSSGGNLESPGNTCGLDAAGDDANVGNPLLGPLGNYGGPTRTMLPLPGSPAVGSALNAQCLDVDQRGEPRGDAACDVGSVERQSGEVAPIFLDGFESGDIAAW